MINEFFCTNTGDAFEVKNATSGNAQPAEWFLNWATGGGSDSGVNVNGYTALTHCPLWQGINIISGDIGQVPIRLLRNEFNEQRKHPAWKLLRTRPNKLQRPSVFKETMIQWALLWGNAVAWIKSDRNGPTDLIPLRPDGVTPDLVDFEGGQAMIYKYISPISGNEFRFFPWEVLHIQGLTSDGMWGYPLHEVGRDTIGHGLALKKHGNAMFRNGAQPLGVLEAPPGATGISKNPEARANLRREWGELHKGPDKAGSIGILWEGIQYKQTSISNIDAQWMDAKKYDRYEAAGLLNLPPHKLGELSDSSVRANLEEQNADYEQRTLRRWFNRLSEEFSRKLLTVDEWLSDDYEFVWDVHEILKPDIDSMATIADKLVKAAIMNPNEARKWFRMKPYEGGDEYGSPAINPRPDTPAEPMPGDPKEEPTPPKDPPKPAVTNAHRELLLDRLTHFLEREKIMLRQSAEESKNFVSWVDKFYDGNGKPPKLLELFDSVAGPGVNAALSVGAPVQDLVAIVQSYGRQRGKALLETCATVTANELPAAVAVYLDKQTTNMAEQLLGVAWESKHGS